MKPDFNNLSQKPRLSVEDSTTENNSLNSDMDNEDISATDQKMIVQELRKTIRKNNTKINDLVAKLTIAENNLASEKEKSIYKDDLIKSLHMSIDLVNQNKDLNIKQMQNQKRIVDLENALDLSSSTLIECRNKIEEMNGEIKEKDIKLVQMDQKNLKYENKLRKKEEHIGQLESIIKAHEIKNKLSKLTIDAGSCQSPSESFVYLNCTKVPSIKFVTLPDFEPFLATFEDVPSAGSDWMLIQRRIDGKLSFSQPYSLYETGFGDLERELWLGCEKLHKLISSRRYELYIELVDFDDVSAFARYDNFVIGSKEEKYMLRSLGEYSGNAGDALRSHTNEPFAFGGNFGWWNINDCNLHGKYYESKVEIDWCGIWWGRRNMGKQISLKSCKMLIRPKN